MRWSSSISRNLVMQARTVRIRSTAMSLLAEVGHGPVHLGRAVTLEDDVDFDQVVIVSYPGIEYFVELVQSKFFTGIVGGKQLGDDLSSPTVPILQHL